MTDPALTYRGAVYPWQCDQVGHMNVMWYVGKFDEASWNLLADLGLTSSYFREQQRGMAAVQQNISYKRELMPGDTVVVRSHVIEIRDKVIRFVHEMTLSDSGESAAVCELTAVHLDRVRRKSTPFPDSVMARARDFQATA